MNKFLKSNKKRVIFVFVVGILAVCLFLYRKEIIYVILTAMIYIFFRLSAFMCECCEESYNKHIPTEIFKIKEERSEKWYEDSNAKDEYFVISNPPKNALLLKKVVEEYNFLTIPTDTLKKYGSYRREFHREGCLTRNYEEGKPYPQLQGCSGLWCFPCYANNRNDGQHIDNHTSDYIVYTSYSHHNDTNWTYFYESGKRDIFNGGKRDIFSEEIHINNIDSFYEEKAKQQKFL